MTITYEERLEKVELFSLEKRTLLQAITTAFKCAKGESKEERNGLSLVWGREGPKLWVRQGEMLLRREDDEGLPGRLHGCVTLSMGGLNNRLCKYPSGISKPA